MLAVLLEGMSLFPTTEWPTYVCICRLTYGDLDEVHALERLVGQKSGIEPPVGDLIEVDATALSDFIGALLRKVERTNNGPLVALAAGCLKIMIAMNAQITGSWPNVHPKLQRLVNEAKTVMWKGSSHNWVES